MHSTSLLRLRCSEAFFTHSPDCSGREHPRRAIRHLVLSVLVFLALGGFAQSQSGTVRGRVTDETNALIPGATVTAKDSSGKTFPTVSTADGSYVLRGL